MVMPVKPLSCRVLLIEDDPIINRSLGDFLRLEGCRVMAAVNARAGLDAAREARPDIILCDVKLPGMDGYQALATARADPALAGVPFVFLTGTTTPFAVEHSGALQPDACLAKPFDVEDLLQVMARLVQTGAAR